MRELLALVLSCVAGCGAGAPRAPNEPAAPPPPPPPTVAHTLITYNTWLLPPVARDRRARARLIPDHLDGHDVIVLTEAFEDEARAPLVAELERRGYHATPVLGDGVQAECGTSLGPVRLSLSLGVNGGVVVLGRHALEHHEQRLFGDACAGEDCCAPKGVTYARFRNEGSCVHVLGTHLQNQDPESTGQTVPAEARARQLHVVRGFIDEVVDQRACPGPVFVAGDLNLTRPELPDAAGILNARVPDHFAGPRSWGPPNLYADDGDGAHLDYVLVTKDYEPPVYSDNETRVLRAEHDFTRGTGIIGLTEADVLADLSDHHAVAARFEWGSPGSSERLWWTTRVDVSQDEACVTLDSGRLCGTTPLSVRDGAICGAPLRLLGCPAGLGRSPCVGLDDSVRCLQTWPTQPLAGRYDDYLCWSDSRGHQAGLPTAHPPCQHWPP